MLEDLCAFKELENVQCMSVFHILDLFVKCTSITFNVVGDEFIDFLNKLVFNARVAAKVIEGP